MHHDEKKRFMKFEIMSDFDFSRISSRHIVAHSFTLFITLSCFFSSHDAFSVAFFKILDETWNLFFRAIKV